MSFKPALGGAASLHLDSTVIPATPIRFYALSWILLAPLLFYATNSSPSLLSDTNSTLMTNDNVLLKMNSGPRPQVLISYMFMFGLMILGRNEIMRAVAKNKFLLLSGVVLAVASAAWSTVPVVTLRYSLDLALTVGLACYLSERFSTENLMRLMMLAGTAAALASIALALFLPSYGVFHRYEGGAWQGIFSHKNALGVGMVLFLTPVFFSRQALSVKAFYSSLLLMLIVLSQSRTAWFVALSTLVFVLWLYLFRFLRGVESFILTVGTLCLAGVAAIAAVSHLTTFMTWLGKDPTLSGRTQIYEVVIDSIVKHPIGGYGYGAFWIAANPESHNVAMRVNWPSIGYAENGFLELGLQLGLAGIAISIFIIGRALIQGLRLLRTPRYTPAIGWFTVLIFVELSTNIDAGVVLAPGNLIWTLTLVAALGLANETRQAQAGAHDHLTPLVASGHAY
jgi:exopolysaccharide production protein ExoQ